MVVRRVLDPRERLDSFQEAQSETEGSQRPVEPPVETWFPGLRHFDRGLKGGEHEG